VSVVAVTPDLMFATRVCEAASRSGLPCLRIDSPAELPPAPELEAVIVDWAERAPEWAADLRAWQASGSPAPPLILAGPHRDLEAHAAAAAAGLGPMWARSALFRRLPELFAPSHP
jgi:hypothetical protein